MPDAYNQSQWPPLLMADDLRQTLVWGKRYCQRHRRNWFREHFPARLAPRPRNRTRECHDAQRSRDVNQLPSQSAHSSTSYRALGLHEAGSAAALKVFSKRRGFVGYWLPARPSLGQLPRAARSQTLPTCRVAVRKVGLDPSGRSTKFGRPQAICGDLAGGCPWRRRSSLRRRRLLLYGRLTSKPINPAA